jgi:hypothetical protein
MNFNKALGELIQTHSLTSDMLQPLGVSFEAFLRLGQMSKERQDRAIARLIEKLKKRT